MHESMSTATSLRADAVLAPHRCPAAAERARSRQCDRSQPGRPSGGKLARSSVPTSSRIAAALPARPAGRRRTL